MCIINFPEAFVLTPFKYIAINAFLKIFIWKLSGLWVCFAGIACGQTPRWINLSALALTLLLSHYSLEQMVSVHLRRTHTDCRWVNLSLNTQTSAVNLRQFRWRKFMNSSSPSLMPDANFCWRWVYLDSVSRQQNLHRVVSVLIAKSSRIVGPHEGNCLDTVAEDCCWNCFVFFRYSGLPMRSRNGSWNCCRSVRTRRWRRSRRRARLSRTAPSPTMASWRTRRSGRGESGSWMTTTPSGSSISVRPRPSGMSGKRRTCVGGTRMRSRELLPEWIW